MNGLESLSDILKKNPVILGVGNVLRRDDGFGSLLAQRLKKVMGQRVIDGGIAPENFLGHLVKQNSLSILIIDALDFGGIAGEFKIFYPQDLNTTNFFTTHNSSLSLLIKFLQQQSEADIIILAVQPKAIKFGEGLSKELSLSLEKIERFILGQMRNNPKKGAV